MGVGEEGDIGEHIRVTPPPVAFEREKTEG